MNFTKPSLWVSFVLPLSILLILVASTFGQTAKPNLVKDIKLGINGSLPGGFTQLNNKTYFTAEGDFNGIYSGSDRRVFSMANGTAVPQVLPTNIGNGTIFTQQKPFLLNNELFLIVRRTNNDTIKELWKTNGTTESVVDTIVNFPRLQTLNSASGSVYDNKLYVTASSAAIGGRTNIDLFRHTGINGSRQLVAKMLREDTLPTGSFFNYWRSEVKGYYPTPDVTFLDITLDSSNATNLRGFRRTIRAFDHLTGITKDLYTLNWRGDFGASTNILTNYKVLGAVNSKLLFTSTESATYNFPPIDTLFSLDKAGVKTVIQLGVGSAKKIINLGNRIFYLDAYDQIWETDGTAAGTRLLLRGQGLTIDIYYANGQVFYLTSTTTYVPTSKVVNHIWLVGGGEVGSFENTIIDNDQLVIYKDDKNLFFVPQKTEVDTSRRYVYQVGGSVTPFKQIGLLSKCKRDPFGGIPKIPIDTCPCLNIIASNTPFTPTPFTVVDSTLLFVAYDNIYGGEIWRMNLNPINSPLDPCATDTTKPVFSNCPTNINLTTATTTAIANWTTPTATDNCTATPSVSSNYTSGSPFGIGTTAVTYTATDAKSNSATCSFTVTVSTGIICANDFTPPVFSNCPQNINLVTTGTSAIATWTAPSVTDDCPLPPSVSSNYISGQTFPVGPPTTVIYTAKDAGNNISTCSFTVKVASNIPPVANCASHSNAPWNEWIAYVGFRSFVNESDKTRPDLYALGYSDWRDKTITATRGATYNFAVLPRLSWGGYQTNLYFRAWIDYNKDGIYDDTELVLQATNPTNGSGVIRDIIVPTTALLGTTTMRISMKKDAYSTACEVFAAGEVEDYTVNILDNPTTSCANNVLNFDGVDDYLQTIQKPIPASSDFTIEASFTSTATTTGCSGNFKRLLSLELSNSLNRLEIGDCAGQLTVYYYIEGGVTGLVSVANATNLRNGSWHHVAAVKKGDSLLVYYDGAMLTSITGMTNINNLARALFIGRWSQQGENWQGNIDEIRVWNYAVSATDIQTRRTCQLLGNETGLTLYLPLNQGVSGGSNPTVNSVLDKAFGNTTIMINFALQGQTSNWICSTQSLSEGCAGNPCTNDVIPPVLTNCPTNMNLTTMTTSIVQSWTAPTATDNCGTPSVSSNYPGGGTFFIGTTTVIYTATDAKNNTATCSFTVTVSPTTNPCTNDVTPPVLINCPTNINLTTTTTTAVATWAAPTATDNCGTPSVSSTHNSGFAFSIGSTTVIYTATDAKNNTATCSFTVTVSSPNTGTCKKYTASSTNSICNPATWQPYILRNSTDRYVADGLEFKETSTGTATLKGTLRSPTWQAVAVDLTFSGKTTTGTPQKINCLTPSVSTANWVYYSTVSGTIGLPTGSISVNTLANALQIGMGANTQDINTLGGYTKITSGATSLDLAFKMSNETIIACESGSNSCANNALNFDGNDDYLQTLQYIIPANTNFTLEASFISTATATICSGNFKRLLALELSNSSNRLEIGDCSGQLTLFYFISGGSSKLYNIPNATNLRDGNYHHVAAVKNGDILTIFYDGVLVDTETGLANINNVPRELYVGRWGLQGENWQGNVDEVRVWNYAVSAADIVNRRNCQLSGSESGLILYFPFNQGVSGGVNTAITSAIDRSPSNLTTLLSNFGLQGSTSNFVCSTQTLSQGCTTTDPCLNDVITPVFQNCPQNISLTTTGTTAIATWTAPTATDNCTTIPSVTSNFTSGQSFPIGSTSVIYTAQDAKNNAATCSFNIVVTTATTSAADIELTITSTPATYRQWTTNTVRVTAKNIGTITMTNIKIDLKRPAKMSFGGNRIPSVGTFNDFCAGGIECSEWRIPSLTAGATATLDAPFFVLDAIAPIVVTTNLLASTPIDANVANNTANVTLLPAPSALQSASYKPTQLIPIVIQRIAPNPTDGELRILLESLDNREVTFDFYNSLGKVVKSEKKAVEKGLNRLEFSVYNFEQGVYFVTPSTHQGHKVPTKFVKL